MEDSVAIKKIQSLDIDTIIHVFPNKVIGKLFKKSGVKNRIGTSHRFHHFITCNFRPSFTRKNSTLHEAQLNVKLLKPFGIETNYHLDELARYAGFDRLPSFPVDKVPNWNPSKTNVILHPKSQGSAVEWGMKNYVALITSNQANPNIHFYITGTEKESTDIRPYLPSASNFTDLTGALTLKELIGFIVKNKILIACSTGPLHIAGISNIKALGLFSPRKPIHPGRWKPLGIKSKTIVYDKFCKDCQKGKDCNCIQKINATRINQIAFLSK
jgi:ADP-heptose:LPS heptosyltransferase